MKSLPVAICLLVCLPVLALAQSTPPPEAPAKLQPFEPVLPQGHTGDGRIGVRIDFDKSTGLPVIVALTRGGPAADFAFRVGDVIIKIGKNYTSTLSQDEVHLALRGQPGTGVELTIQRDDDPRYVVRSVERRILPAGSEDMTQPPMSGVARQ